MAGSWIPGFQIILSPNARQLPEINASQKLQQTIFGDLFGNERQCDV
jgi:hypothetical protein